MQNDRNYRYAPTFAGGASCSRRQQTVREQQPSCNDGCESGMRERCGGTKEPMVLAMAYVVDQVFEGLYDPEDAHRNGTLFKGLNLPYGGGRC